MLSRAPFTRLFIVLWLICLLDFAEAVRCLSCWDDASNGPEHDTDACPWVTGVAANVTALVGSAATALVVDKLLPVKLLRVFPKAVLSTLVNCHQTC